MTNNVEESLRLLKSLNSSRKIYNTLLHVHSDGIPFDDKLKEFKKKDGLGCIFQFLSKPNEEILNISLGILASCCSDEECCDKILSLGVIKHIIGILRNTNEDRIQCRCYELISNLMRRPNFCSSLISNNICDLMVPVLDGNPSLYTELMAIKAVRCIWMESNANDRKAIASSNVLKSIMKHLTSTNVEVQKSVLEILFCVSRSRSDVILKQAFQEDTIKIMISKATQFPCLVLRIVYHLSEIEDFPFKLIMAGALETMFQYIRDINFEKLDAEKETNIELVLRATHRFCNVAGSERKLDEIMDAFQILLNIIENATSMKFKLFSVSILTSFIQEEDSLRIMVKQRLIIVLVSYLQKVISNKGVPHDKSELKNENTNLPSSPSSSVRFNPLSDCKTVTPMSWSPTSKLYELTLSVNGHYSPVYFPLIGDVDYDDQEDDSEKLSIDRASSKADSRFLPQDDDELELIIEEEIFKLLKRLVPIKEPLYDLCIQRTWETILDYLVLVRRTTVQVTGLLSAIAGKILFFSELLKSQFPLTVHRRLRRPVHTNCSICRKMDISGVQILTRYQEVAESVYGHQTLRNEFRQNNCQRSKMLLTLSIPHIVSDSDQLEEYFLGYKALDIFVAGLNDSNEDLGEKVASLYSLANSLCVENPRTPCNLCRKCDVASLVEEATISFLLDDGSTVTANKRTLCEKSVFFEAMFRSGFKEALQSTVRLPNITSDCLTVLLRLLYSDCDCIVPRNVINLLELIVQSDRFLIPTLFDRLLHTTMNSRLNYANCHIIYNWAMEHCKFLPSLNDWSICRNVVKYALAEKKITFSQRLVLFKKLLESKHKSSVLKDVMQVMEFQLKCKGKAAAKRYKKSPGVTY